MRLKVGDATVRSADKTPCFAGKVLVLAGRVYLLIHMCIHSTWYSNAHDEPHDIQYLGSE